MNIPFHKPILPKDIKEIFPSSVESGWLTTGPQVEKFEQNLANYLGSKNVVSVNSCTAALHLALAAKGFQRGDRFIVPTNTFVASVEVGEYLGMNPILVDSCEDDFNFDLNMVEHILKKESKVKAIIPVHFAGKPVDMKKVLELADKFGLFVLEDAAHSLEAISNTGKVGDTNYATAFSFYANKNITTCGEGGALSTNDKNLSEKIRKLSLHGISKDGWKRFKSHGKWRYDISELGYKYNMNDISAAMGIWQLKNIDKWYDVRKWIIETYNTSFENIEGLMCPRIEDGIKEAFHLYILKINSDFWKLTRNQIIEEINKKGIGTSVHYIPVHMHSYYIKKYGYSSSDYPNAEALSESVISIPLYPALKPNQINYIIDSIIEIWEKFKI
jgi:dTDP-4-amino-4,6-dideoxygalactose transaminase